MKRFIHDVVNLKFLIGLYFGGILMTYTFLLFILDTKFVEVVRVWEILGLSICLGFAHLIYFTDLKPIIRVVLNFGVCLSSILVFDYFFKWTLIDFIGIPIFILGLLVFYIGGAIAFYIYYKNEELLLNEGLLKLKKET